MYYRQIGNYVSRISRVAYVLFELCHLPPKIFQNPPGHEDINISKKKYCNGFLCRFVLCKLCNFEKAFEIEKPYYLGESYYCNILFKQAAK